MPGNTKLANAIVNTDVNFEHLRLSWLITEPISPMSQILAKLASGSG